MLPVGLGLLASSGFGLLGLIILMCWVLGLVDVTRSRELDRQKRLAWILIIVLLPIIGTLAYFYSRPAPPHDRDKTVNAQSRGRGLY